MSNASTSAVDQQRWPAVLRLASPVALLLLWQGLSSTGVIASDIVSPPSQIARSFIDSISSGELPSNMLASLARVSVGLLLALVLGTTLGVLSGLSRLGELIIDPPLQIVRSLPFLGLIPLFIIWFGIGEVSKIALITLGATFPLYLNLYGGIRAVDPKLIEAGRMLGLGHTELITRIVLPGSLASFLVGLRYSVAVAWLSLVVVEQVNATSGLGYMINDARDFVRTDIILMCLFMYGLLGLISDFLIRRIERTALAWRPSIVKS